MAKPVKLYWEFYPKFKDNHLAPEEDRFRVVLSDLSEADRIKALNELSEIMPDTPPSQLESKQSELTMKDAARIASTQWEWAQEVARSRIRRVIGLSIVTDEESDPIEVKTSDDVIKYCPGLAIEVANRAVFGLGEEEGKDSGSDVGSTPKETS